MSEKLTGYPSIDKPWLKYYSEEAINTNLPDCSLYEYLYMNNKDYPQDIALNYFGRKITYRELFEQIDVVAKAFTAQGVKAGDVVSVVTISCVTSILCFYALNKIGAVSDYVNALSSQDEMKKYFEDSESKIVVILDLFGEKIVSAAEDVQIEKIIVYSLTEWMPTGIKLGYKYKMRNASTEFMRNKKIVRWRDFLVSGKNVELDSRYLKNPSGLCFLAHTGGTTGFPKSVLISDKAMNSVAQQYKVSFVHERQQVFMNILIPWVMYGTLTCMHMPLCLGLQVVIIPKLDVKEWSTYIKQYKPNHIVGIPSSFIPMLSDEKMRNIDLSNIITFASGGDGFTRALEEQMNDFLEAHGFKNKFIQGYGMTEVGASALTGFAHANKIGSVGIPFPQNNVKIYNNEQAKECQYGEVGEVCLLCVSQMIGYKDNKEETHKLMREHEDGNQWIHTGDLGYIDEDGFLFLAGRMKRMVIVGSESSGCKVYPQLVEQAISSCDKIREICVVSAPEGSEYVLKAFIVLKKQESASHAEIERELRELSKRELPEYMQPRFYEFIEAMPLTSVGKVDYRALEET